MARTKGSANKNSEIRPVPCELTTEQRLQLVANLIIDRIAYDQEHKQELLKQIREEPSLCTIL